MASVVFGLMLAILIPTFSAMDVETKAAAEAAANQQQPQPQQPAPDVPSTPPNFSVAVGMDDEVTEMPAIQSAMMDYLAFSDEFFDRLKTGGLVPEFATEEREISPDSARAQVKDGTSVMAVVLPTKLTPTVIDDIRAYYRGEIDNPKYTITVVAGPQALNEDEYIVKKYSDQVIRQATEHISTQIRTVARKTTCADAGRTDCPRTQDEVVKAFERPFETKVDKVDGPDPIDYFGQGEDASAAPAPPTPSAEVNAGTPPEQGTQSNTDVDSGASGLGSALIVVTSVLSALAIASAVLALLASFLVNRRAGLQLVVIGPWRSLTPQRPIPRRSLLSAKLVISLVGSTVLALLTTIALTWLGQDAYLSFSAYPELRAIALFGLLALVSYTVAAIILTTTDVLGGVFGLFAAIVTIILVAYQSGVPAIIGQPSASLDLYAIIASIFSAGGLNFAVTYILSAGIGLLVVAILVVAVGLVVTRIYDNRFTTRIDYSG